MQQKECVEDVGAPNEDGNDVVGKGKVVLIGREFTPHPRDVLIERTKGVVEVREYEPESNDKTDFMEGELYEAGLVDEVVGEGHTHHIGHFKHSCGIPYAEENRAYSENRDNGTIDKIIGPGAGDVATLLGPLQEGGFVHSFTFFGCQGLEELGQYF